MFEENFILRLIVNLILGIVFIFALISMARHNNQETTPKRHTAMALVGALFLGLGMLSLSGLARNSAFITHTWVMMCIANFSLCVGIAGYLLSFKSSHSPFWKKLLKFLFFLLMAFLLSGSIMQESALPAILLTLFCCAMFFLPAHKSVLNVSLTRTDVENKKDESARK